MIVDKPGFERPDTNLIHGSEGINPTAGGLEQRSSPSRKHAEPVKLVSVGRRWDRFRRSGFVDYRLLAWLHLYCVQRDTISFEGVS